MDPGNPFFCHSTLFASRGHESFLIINFLLILLVEFYCCCILQRKKNRALFCIFIPYDLEESRSIPYLPESWGH